MTTRTRHDALACRPGLPSPAEASGPERPADARGPVPLRVVAGRGAADPVAAEEAAAAFLTALGLPTGSAGMQATPGRMARAYAEMLTARPFEATTFPNDSGYDGLVLARSVPVHSVCEHHMLPFVGVAHVGYLPGDRILGLSKLARVVELYARRPQVQERLTTQVADWLQTNLTPRGAGVVIEAEHLCMTLRGVRAGGATTVTSALRGQLRDEPRARAEFYSLAGSGSTTPGARSQEAVSP